MYQPTNKTIAKLITVQKFLATIKKQLLLGIGAAIFGLVLMNIACANIQSNMPTLKFDSDHNQPIHISANWAEFNQKTGANVFHGQVMISQGQTQLTGDEVTIYLTADNQINKLITTGNPAQFRENASANSASTNTNANANANAASNNNNPTHIFNAQAQRIEYYPQQHKILLIGQGQINKNGNILKGPHIAIDTQQQTIISSPTQKGRTTIIIPAQSATHSQSVRSAK